MPATTPPLSSHELTSDLDAPLYDKKEEGESKEKLAAVSTKYLKKVLSKVGVALITINTANAEPSSKRELRLKALVARMAGAMIVENIENIERAADEIISLSVSE